MRICLLSYRSNPHCGGQGVYVTNLSRELCRLGHQVDVISGPPLPVIENGSRLFALPSLDLYNPDDLFRVPTFSELLDPANVMEWAGVSTMGFPEPFTFGIRAQRFLSDRLHHYDIVHDNQSLSYGLNIIGRRIPTVATIHHPITIDRDIAVRTAPSVWKKLKQRRWYSFTGMQRRVARKLPRIITVSNAARNDIVKAFGLPPNRFSIVPNGIDTEIFQPIPGISRDPNRLIVTNSADIPLKGLGFLLKAVANISQKRPVRLIVVGQPKKDSEIIRLIRLLGIGDLVNFTGRINQRAFARQYAKASVAVVPSVYEGFGLPAGEAMACGVPVVSTTAGALPEVVGDAGLLVPPADHMALADAILRVLDSPQLAAALGEAGYRRVRKHFTWRRTAELTVKAYRQAFNAHR